MRYLSSSPFFIKALLFEIFNSSIFDNFQQVAVTSGRCILLIKYAWIMTAYVNWPKRSSHCGSDQFHHAITDRKWGAGASGGSAKLAPCNNLLRGAVNMAQEFETRRDSCKPLIIGSQGFSPDSPKSRKLRVDQSSVERVSVCWRWELKFSGAWSVFRISVFSNLASRSGSWNYESWVSTWEETRAAGIIPDPGTRRPDLTPYFVMREENS